MIASILQLLMTASVASWDTQCGPDQELDLVNHTSYEVPDSRWPRGRFIALGDTLFWASLDGSEFSTYRLEEGKPQIICSLTLETGSKKPRITAIDASAAAGLFALLSGPQETVLHVNLSDEICSVLWTGDVPGYSQGLRYLPKSGRLLIMGQNSSVLVDEGGNPALCGPEVFHGKYCCVFASAGVQQDDAVALNVNRGLRVYQNGQEREVWTFQGGWYVREIAAVRDGWAVIEAGVEEERSRLRVFWPDGADYATDVMQLPTPFDWRITELGDNAIVWARSHPAVFMVTKSEIFPVDLPSEVHTSTVVRSVAGTRLFAVGSTGYSSLRLATTE